MAPSDGTYHLGIDLGTTYAAAGVLRQGRPEVVTLGDRSPVVPSVLYFKDDGEVLTGEPANRRGLMDPSRVVREFKRRVGDTTPLVVGQTPYSAEALLAKLLRFVYNTVTDRQGSSPNSITISHPANWGSYKIDVLRQAIRMADVGEVQTITEPVAAAIHYAASERLDPGQAVAVYDLGGGTFDAAVVRKSGETFEVLGDVEGIEQLGGIDLDEAVFQHVVRWCESAFQDLDYDDQASVQAVARLRQECVAAKEALSADTDVAIPVVLPNLQTEVRLTRAEFESMIRPLIQQTVEALRRAVRSAGVEAADLAAVLLVGGSSQIPLVAEMVGAELGRPIAVDQHPKHTVALGAAIAAGRTGAAATSSSPIINLDRARSEPAPDQMVGVAQSAVATGTSSVAARPIPTPAAKPLAHLSPPGGESPTAQLARGASRPPSPTIIDQPVRYEPRNETALATGRGGGDGSGGGERSHQFEPQDQPRSGGSSNRTMLLAGSLVLVLLAVGGAVWAQSRSGQGSDNDAAEGFVASEATSSTVRFTRTTVGNSDAQVAATNEPVAEDTTTSQPSTSTSEATTVTTEAVESTTTTIAVDPDLVATISNISLADGRYIVEYTTSFSPLISSDPESHHLHFFFDTVGIAQAGTPGSGPWILYDGPSPFSQYGVADKPAAATQMCVTAATHAHAVADQAVFHCLDLPAS